MVAFVGITQKTFPDRVDLGGGICKENSAPSEGGINQIPPHTEITLRFLLL